MRTRTQAHNGFSFTNLMLALPVIVALTHPNIASSTAQAARHAIEYKVADMLPTQGMGMTGGGASVGGGALYVSGGPIYLR